MALWLCLRYIVLSGVAWHGRYVEEYSDEDDDVDAIEDLFANYGSGSCMLHRSVSALHAVLYGASCTVAHVTLYCMYRHRCAALSVQTTANDRDCCATQHLWRLRLLRHSADTILAAAGPCHILTVRQ